jgi:hypothetical protein
MRDHFPFWRPIIITLLIVAVPGALFFGAKYYTAQLWGDTVRARAECRAAAGMAAHILRSKDLIDPAAAKDPVQFSPVLRGAPTEIMDRRLPDWLHGVRGYLLLPEPLDCSPEFAGLPLIRKHVPTDVLLTRVHFSRLLFGTDSNVGYASIDTWCGNECGNGWQTRWRRHGKDWELESVRMLWIS